MRTATVGVCSNESGIDSRRICIDRRPIVNHEGHDVAFAAGRA
jgi:hypothetical protein